MKSLLSWVSLLPITLTACAGNTAPTCPTGTNQVGDTCVLVQDRLTCGAGTVESGGVCLSASDGVMCGSGTHLDGADCLPNSDGAACGPGTHLSGQQCVSDGGGVACGPGTKLAGAQCVPDGSSGVVCGQGTHLNAGQCVPDGQSLVCGPGTFEQNGQCVVVGNPPNGETYEVFIGASVISADGFTKVPVLAVGKDANGNPSTASVILKPSRGDAGAVTPFNITLGPLGATTYFTPCNGTQDPACLGAFNVTLALANAPNTVVGASASADLVAPMGVGSPAACLVGGNTVFFDGDAQDYIHPGTDLIQLGQWSAQFSTFEAAIHVTPSSQSQGLWWDFTFATDQLNQPLQAQVYDKAERWPFESPGKPGLDVSGDGKGCNMLSGRFEVETLTMSGNTVSAFTATFEQHCENGAAALHGCVHFEQ